MLLARTFGDKFAVLGKPSCAFVLLGEDDGTSGEVFLELAVVVEDNEKFGLNAARALKRLRTGTFGVTSMFVSQSFRGKMGKDIDNERGGGGR